MEDIIALAEAEGIPLINPGRAHHFEIDKRLATETLRNAGITAPAIIAGGIPAEPRQKAAADLDDSRSVALSREEASEAWSLVRQKPKSPPHRWPWPTTGGPTLASSAELRRSHHAHRQRCAALPPPAHF